MKSILVNGAFLTFTFVIGVGLNLEYGQPPITPYLVFSMVLVGIALAFVGGEEE